MHIMSQYVSYDSPALDDPASGNRVSGLTQGAVSFPDLKLKIISPLESPSTLKANFPITHHTKINRGEIL